MDVWIESFDTFGAATLMLSESFKGFFAFKPTVDMDMQSPLESPFHNAANGFLEISKKLNRVILPSVRQMFEIRCLQPLASILALVGPIDTLLQERKSVLLDFDSYRSRIEKEHAAGRDSQHPLVVKKAMKLDEVAKQLYSLNNTICASFDEFEKARTITMGPEFSSFVACFYHFSSYSSELSGKVVPGLPQIASSLYILESFIGQSFSDLHAMDLTPATATSATVTSTVKSPDNTPSDVVASPAVVLERSQYAGGGYGGYSGRSSLLPADPIELSSAAEEEEMIAEPMCSAKESAALVEPVCEEVVDAVAAEVMEASQAVAEPIVAAVLGSGSSVDEGVAEDAAASAVVAVQLQQDESSVVAAMPPACPSGSPRQSAPATMHSTPSSPVPAPATGHTTPSSPTPSTSVVAGTSPAPVKPLKPERSHRASSPVPGSLGALQPVTEQSGGDTVMDTSSHRNTIALAKDSTGGGDLAEGLAARKAMEPLPPPPKPAKPPKKKPAPPVEAAADTSATPAAMDAVVTEEEKGLPPTVTPITVDTENNGEISTTIGTVEETQTSDYCDNNNNNTTTTNNNISSSSSDAL